MLDRYIVPLLKRPLRAMAVTLERRQVNADRLTVVGFLFGLLCIGLVAFAQPYLALPALLLNRLIDGIDGELARLQSPTDAGGYLDITLDFIFYAFFPVGFALLDPLQNALPAAVLVASFVGTGASFLAFASLAEKRGVEHPDFAYKGFYYLDGLAEGTETIVCFVLMCIFPQFFPLLAWSFAVICIITAINRVVFGYRTLR